MMMRLGDCYLVQHRYSEAENLYREALKFRLQVLNNKHPDVADSLNSLALCLYKQRKFAEPEPFYLRAKAIWEEVFGSDNYNVALVVHNLLWQTACRFTQFWEKTIGTEHPLYARSLDRLAGIYTRQGKLDEAESLYERALAIREKRLGAEHSDTVSTRQSLEQLRCR